MLGLELVVVLGVAALVGNAMGERFGIAPPVLLLVIGAALGFVPAVRQAQLPPEVVLLLFLPVLLYWESLTTSLREIRTNLRGIMLLSTVLVILTAWAVAAAGHALGLPWGPAWVLGAAVAPTDATSRCLRRGGGLCRGGTRGTTAHDDCLLMDELVVHRQRFGARYRRGVNHRGARGGVGMGLTIRGWRGPCVTAIHGRARDGPCRAGARGTGPVPVPRRGGVPDHRREKDSGGPASVSGGPDAIVSRASLHAIPEAH